MRTLILLALVLSLSAASAPPVEDFKLTDGRMLTGVYDEDAQTLTIMGGKASLTVRPDQIVLRAPTKSKPPTLIDPAPDAPPQMSEEEKTERFRKVGEAAQEADRQKELAEADKADRDAVDYLAKAASRRGQAWRDAVMFRKRALQEGRAWEVESILAHPISLPNTGVTNAAILALMAEGVTYDQLANERRAVAARKRRGQVTVSAPLPAPAVDPAAESSTSTIQIQAEIDGLDRQIGALQARRAALAAQLRGGLPPSPAP